MKSARNTPPTEPVNGITCGIDWARDDHAVSIVDAKGREVTRARRSTHDAAGLRDLLTTLDRAGAREVAIERPDGPVVDTLLEGGITVVVISPNQVKNLRGRYGSAGNKDDRFDAFVLADTLRTDRARLHPLLPDTPATTALRQTCRARKDLVAHRVAVANQLRAHLKIVFPGAVGLFADDRLADQPGVPDPLRLSGPRRLAVGHPPGDVAGQRRLQRPHASPRAAPPADHALPGATNEGTARRDHRSVRSDTDRLNTQISVLDDQHRRPTRRARRRAHLHVPAALGHLARRPTARRDRGLPRPLPHPRSAGLPGRGRPLDPPVGQDHTRRIPLGR